MTFSDFNFDPRLQEGLDTMGYQKPTPIQQQAIPEILNNRDMIACAQTGTGKTAAYLLPIMHKILKAEKRHINTLIIAPTRELALQIDQQIEGFAYFAGISSVAVYGGGDGFTWDRQKKAMKEGADIVIATPGRLIAQLMSGTIDLKHLEHLILDEADRMLDMGFYDDIMKIIAQLPSKKQTLLFSATMAPAMRKLANGLLNDPAEINIAISKPAEGISQQAYMVYDAQKLKLICDILKSKAYSSAIIFASTKEKVKRLHSELQRSGIASKAFHSDLDQDEREMLMSAFKNKKISVLVGTDVLSRGIDVEGISLVINYDVPPDPEDYIHRIGRTARAETTGTAITFINDIDQQKFARIEALIGKEVPKLAAPETLQLGEVPAYSPGTRNSSSSGRNKNFSRGKRKSGFRPRPKPGA